MTFATLRSGMLLGLALVCGMAVAPAASAQNNTAQALIDRQQVLDLITRYYYNFGKENQENFADFYAEDAVLILGARRFEGRQGILQAYGRAPAPAAAPAAGAAPAPAAAPAAPPRERPKRYAFNVTLDNALIVVHGDTATSQVIFTEYVQEKQGDPVKMTTQGKEYGTFVKVKGQWRYKTRQIAGGSEPPAGWKE